ncbi:putative progesterone binding protein [Ascoidea rubescens DSM 1968]|uniref:Putative progesterone binding protein n=1 Tax=Ascoidea rubescens DSM 1968 TaxID=1344418 RepID=A0A1D2VEK9_9ASCO|nr:putative progesterone binding protein [Ascoidea rubescens DSM 1968]ODV60055.1 putative progesterone binding protein [Ascoidea rubescens DSM 1968]
MSGKFTPKVPVKLEKPKDDPFTSKDLLKFDGIQSDKIYVAIKRVVFDVSKNPKAYGSGKGYHCFVGKDASRGLGKSSLSAEDNDPKISYKFDDLNEKETKVLNDWYTYFEKRYNIVGKVIDLD